MYDGGMDHHPIFSRYALAQKDEPGVAVDFMGARVRHAIEAPEVSGDVSRPAFGEAYFEYVDVLEAVAEARGSFAMLELGAGFGRWSAIAARAAAQIGKPSWFGLVEAEPRLVRDLHTVMGDNGVTNYRVWEAALGGTAGEAIFAVRQPNPQAGWLGQAVTRNDMTGARIVGEHYGAPLWEMADGWGVIRVPQITLSSILAECGEIDLADFDLQGVEAEVIAESVDALTAKVKRLHIGTHGHDIEKQLRSVLSEAGWTLAADYACQQVNATPYGDIAFGDGVQSWRNPSL